MLRARLNVRSLKSLSGPLWFLAYRLRDQFKLRGLFVSISGPDGSGKTTVIREVAAQLETIFGAGEVRNAHFRPTVLPRIAKVAKKARAINTVDENYEQPHRAKPSGVIGSAMRLIYYWFDYLGGYFRHILPVLKRREVMLFDRYYFDMIADPSRSRIALPKRLMRVLGRLLPLPDYAFFIRVDPEEIRRRKQELTIERIVELNGQYEDLVRRGWLIPIENNGSPEEAAAAIVDCIIADRHAKAIRALR
ncbi:Thymidylate kinase [Mesorhizobium australicum]|uniref:Thymidylate kinase n=2 Tax=Mesorhizobium australicum TaxID=536018 RepID=A0A1X7NRC7_9HYPH|nr:Thymidylate kinase [Mesorhizobium australicum]